MSRQFARKPASWAKRGPNARKDDGDHGKIRALARSRAKHQITPLLARSDGTCIDGNRTLLGLELEGMLDVELDFIITDEDLTADEVIEIQAASAIHREDLPDYDKAVAMRDILAARQGMTQARLATDVLFIDEGLVSKYLTVFKCAASVQEAARSGLIGVTKWYACFKSKDQDATLAELLNGASRDDAARKARQPQATAVRTARIKCPLASGHVITVAGDDISLEEAIESLSEAIKAMKAAVAKGLNAKTAQNVWRDMAEAG
jgi:hypothetical protein